MYGVDMMDSRNDMPTPELPDLHDCPICTLLELSPELEVEAARAAIAERAGNGAEIALLRGKLWKPGRTLRVKFLGGSPRVQERICHHAATWTRDAGANLR